MPGRGFSPDQLAALDELERRRASLAPAQLAALDELKSRRQVFERAITNLQGLGATADDDGMLRPAHLPSLDDPLDPNRSIIDRGKAYMGGLYESTIGGAVATGRDAVNTAIGDTKRFGPLSPFITGPRLVKRHLVDPAISEGRTAYNLATSSNEETGSTSTASRLFRAAGHGFAAALPLVGPAAAATGEQVLEDPYRAAGGATGLVGMAVAPTLVKGAMKNTGALGRGLQRSAARTMTKAVGATKRADAVRLQGIDKATGAVKGPIGTVLDQGGNVSLSRTRLLDSLEQRADTAGAAVRSAEESISRGTLMMDGHEILRALDDEIGARSNIDPVTGSPQTGIGRTVIDDAAIENLRQRRAEVERSINPDTGQIDFHDLVSRRRTWDKDVYEFKQANQKAMPESSPAFSEKIATDATRSAVNRATPDIAVDRQAFSAYTDVADSLSRHLADDAASAVLGIPRSAWRAGIYRGLLHGAGAMSGVLGATAALDTIVSILRSTPARTFSAQTKWNIGKFLEAGELDQAARVAQAAQAGDQVDMGGGGIGGGAPQGPTQGSASAPPVTPQQLPRLDPDSTSPYNPGVVEAEIVGEPFALARRMDPNINPGYGPGMAGAFVPPTGNPGPRPLPQLPSAGLGVESGIRSDVVPPGGMSPMRPVPVPPTPQLPGSVPGMQPRIEGPQARPMLPPAPIDSLPGGGIRLRAPINPGESSGGAALPQYTATVTPRRLTPVEQPAAPTPVPTPAATAAPPPPRPQSGIAKDLQPRPEWAEQRINRNRERQQRLNDIAASATPAEKGMSLGEIEAQRAAAPTGTTRPVRTGDIQVVGRTNPARERVVREAWNFIEQRFPRAARLVDAIEITPAEQMGAAGDATANYQPFNPPGRRGFELSDLAIDQVILDGPAGMDKLKQVLAHELTHRAQDELGLHRRTLDAGRPLEDLEPAAYNRQRITRQEMEGASSLPPRVRHLGPPPQLPIPDEFGAASADSAPAAQKPVGPKRLPTPTVNIDPAAQLGDRPKAAIAPKQAPKPQPVPEPAKSTVDYSTMSRADLESELGKAQRVRDTYRKMSAGSNAFRQAEDRVKQIESALASQPRNRDASPATEWPRDRNARDENDAMFTNRTKPGGGESNYPSVAIGRMVESLPARFKYARKLKFGTPLRKDIVPGRPITGAYGEPFDKRERPKEDPKRPGYRDASPTVLTHPAAVDSPAVTAHEINHAIYDEDLTPAERNEWIRLFDQNVNEARSRVQAAGIKAGAPDSTQRAIAAAKIPRAIMYFQSTAKAPDSYDEAFSELGAQFMLNPTEFKRTYPREYNYFKKVYGKEYLSGKTTPAATTSSAAPAPQRFTASRRGTKIEGVLARSFSARDGRKAMVLRADDGSERLVFDSEVT